jgi:hypothetical protein
LGLVIPMLSAAKLWTMPGVVILLLSFWLLFVVVGLVLIAAVPSLRFLGSFLAVCSTLLVVGAVAGGWVSSTAVTTAMNVGRNWNPMFFKVMRLVGVLVGAYQGAKYGVRLAKAVNRRMQWKGSLV